jgi:hypothetical protein
MILTGDETLCVFDCDDIVNARELATAGGLLDERAAPVPLARPTSQSKPARRAASERRALTFVR